MGGSSMWLPGVNHRDLMGLGHHNGTFGRFLGVVLHVNVSGKTSQGTSPDWYAAGGGPDSVCPNFQVMRDGTIWQLLPMDVQPWTQADGNYNYASIETGGDPDMPLTDAQLRSCGLIVKAYHDRLGMPLQVANQPGQRGLGIHSMGGAAWGGHSCPGTIRANQRPQILAIASGQPLEDNVPLTAAEIDKIADAVVEKQRIPISKDTQKRLGYDPEYSVAALLRDTSYGIRVCRQQLAAIAASLGTPQKVAAAVVAALPKSATALTEADVEQAVRKVFADAGDAS